MGESGSGVSNGLFSALRNIAATALASGKTRLELLSNEIEAEKLHAIDLLLTVLAVAFCFGVGVILAVALLVSSFWEQRFVILAICSLVFLALGGVLFARFRQESRRSERIFAVSVAELERDLRRLSEDDRP
ncbi:MAG: phage holin family protein [Candidatus Accumulibacter sp.]|jgi:uncharacterized membrane protein YqjE|nr:phage holin family protein [Accumulibacter sp.]